MKLLYCLECLAVMSLRSEIRTCDCKLSAGFYASDDITAHLAGPCVCLGLDTAILERAVRDRRPGGQDVRAFLVGTTTARVVRHGPHDLYDTFYQERRKRSGPKPRPLESRG